MSENNSIWYIGMYELPVLKNAVLLPAKYGIHNGYLFYGEIDTDGHPGLAFAPDMGVFPYDSCTGSVATIVVKNGSLELPDGFLPKGCDCVLLLGVGDWIEIYAEELPEQGFTFSHDKEKLLDEAATIKADFHIHALDHKYYPARSTKLAMTVLDEEDKKNIRNVVDWCIKERGLDIVALTDHGMIQPSLYARDYVLENKLPIKIITGAECEVAATGSDTQEQFVHLLCLNIDSLPFYDEYTTIRDMAAAVHKMGGYIVMAHPICYPRSFFDTWRCLDGYEYINATKPPFDEGKAFVKNYSATFISFNNSDYHHKGSFVPGDWPNLQCTYLSRKFVRDTFGGYI